MRIIPDNIVLSAAMKIIKHQSMNGTFDGITESFYFRQCQWQLPRHDLSIIFTRDVGPHSGGWWKNPDYEYCYHLSICFFGGKSKKKLEDILDGLFTPSGKRMLWIEPPISPEGKSKEIWHYRLFCDDHWVPIIPRGEVYSKRYTESGWKSYSELHAK